MPIYTTLDKTSIFYSEYSKSWTVVDPQSRLFLRGYSSAEDAYEGLIECLRENQW